MKANEIEMLMYEFAHSSTRFTWEEWLHWKCIDQETIDEILKKTA